MCSQFQPGQPVSVHGADAAGRHLLGLNLAAGGHLTHGAPVNQSGKWFNVVSYGVYPQTNSIACGTP
jgi:glycine/serine hydroxymethyltransferase